MNKAYGMVLAWNVSLISAVGCAALGAWGASLLFFLSWLIYTYLIFKDSMNLVQNVGRVYWIVRDNGNPNVPRIARGFMRQYAAPWLYGKGIQVRFRRWTMQVGTCQVNHSGSEVEGLLKAVDGRYMEETPKDIGVWT